MLALLFPLVVETYSLGFSHLFAKIFTLFVNHCKQRLRSFHVSHPRRRLGHNTHFDVTSIRIQQLLFDNFSTIFALMIRMPTQKSWSAGTSGTIESAVSQRKSCSKSVVGVFSETAESKIKTLHKPHIRDVEQTHIFVYRIRRRRPRSSPETITGIARGPGLWPNKVSLVTTLGGRENKIRIMGSQQPHNEGKFTGLKVLAHCLTSYTHR